MVFGALNGAVAGKADTPELGFWAQGTGATPTGYAAGNTYAVHPHDAFTVCFGRVAAGRALVGIPDHVAAGDCVVEGQHTPFDEARLNRLSQIMGRKYAGAGISLTNVDERLAVWAAATVILSAPPLVTIVSGRKVVVLPVGVAQHGQCSIGVLEGEACILDKSRSGIDGEHSFGEEIRRSARRWRGPTRSTLSLTAHNSDL